MKYIPSGPSNDLPPPPPRIDLKKWQEEQQKIKSAIYTAHIGLNLGTQPRPGK